jgi:NADPH-dependent ferric siderophore reductase
MAGGCTVGEHATGTPTACPDGGGISIAGAEGRGTVGTMPSDAEAPPPTRTRRAPPPFRRLTVRAVTDLSPRLRRVVLGGPELDGLRIDEPAASVRVLFPPAGESELVMPTWTGNQFELPDGRRAPIRTFTPRLFEPDRSELTIDLVLHGRGLAADWASAAGPGDAAAISGPARGDPIDPATRSILLAGDETAVPAISQLLGAAPSDAAVQAHIEIADDGARVELPAHPGAEVTWHVLAPGRPPGDAFATAVEAMTDLPHHIWIAGEAAAVQRLRKHLFESRGLTRATVTARGYWKHGRSAT